MREIPMFPNQGLFRVTMEAAIQLSPRIADFKTEDLGN